MGRMLLGLLVAVMLSMTGYVAYSTFAPTDGTAVNTSTCDSHKACCKESAPACCSEATAEAAPACCSEKAACCETKGEAGTCCQGAAKAKAIAAAAKKSDEAKPESKKD